LSSDKIMEAVRSFYSRKDSGHDCSHAMRVRETALYIAAREGGNPEIVEVAALLHDIGRETAMEKSHAGSSANLAVSILQKNGYAQDVIEGVKHCILVHSLEMGEPETLEAKILFDADKLDFCGPIGMARLFIMCGAERRAIYPAPGQDKASAKEVFQDKVRHFPDKLYTPTARQLLGDNHEFVLEFWARLEKQVIAPEKE
jgi:uncharacterized protein